MVDLSVLRGAFVALKHGHDRNFFKKSMEKVLKFVEDLPTVYLFQEFFKMLLEYMQRRSELESEEFNEIIDQKLEPDMATNFKTIFEVAEERGEQRGVVIGEQRGEQRGIAIGEARVKEILHKAILAFIRTTSFTDAEIAIELDTDETLVSTIRKEVQSLTVKKNRKK
jgi:hypothetical protein